MIHQGIYFFGHTCVLAVNIGNVKTHVQDSTFISSGYSNWKMPPRTLMLMQAFLFTN